MIVISIAVLAILLLIACVGLNVLNEGVKEAQKIAEEHEANWFAETSISSALRNEKHHEWERGEVLQEQVIALKQTIADLQDELVERSQPAQASEEEPETGNFVKRRAMRRATPETYRNVFDLDINGQRVIEHLQLTFANKSTYVRGGQDAERESCFRAGQATVVGFILNQINKANDPNHKDEVND